MHEMSLVHNVVDAVVEEAEQARASKVTAVYLVIGEGRDVVEDYFEGLFGFLARGTVAEDAEVIIHRVPYTMRCNRCGFAFHVDYIRHAAKTCPLCASENDCTFHSGMEFYISKIEASVSASESPRTGCDPGARGRGAA